MKKHPRWLLLFLMMAFFTMCHKVGNIDYSAIDKAAPTLSLKASALHVIPEYTIQVQGTVSDDIGIKSIRLQKADWFLDKLITVSEDSLVKNYALDYKFKVPKNTPMTEHTIIVTVTDVAGKTTTANLKVYMDGDFVAPILTVTSPINGMTMVPAANLKINFDFMATDDRALGYLVIKEPKLNFKDSIPLTGKSYHYVRQIAIPSSTVDYTFDIVLADSVGNKVNSTSVVKVSSDFDVMYLADVSTVTELNSDLFGVPMLIDKTAPFTYSGKYYAETDNVAIRFIPQKTDFAPNCIGLDPTNSTKLINDPATAKPIILPTKGYYNITFNLQTYSYNVQKYTPTDTPFTTILTGGADNVGPLSLVGVGFADYPGQSWNPSSGVILDADPNNAYRFTKNVKLSGSAQFIIAPQHPWGWWMSPFWRFDRSVDPEKTINGGGNNFNMNVATPTTYKLTFDTHLNRAKMVKQ